MWLTRLALRNPVLILMLSLMLMVLGLVSLRRLSVDLFPELTIPVVRVATFYSGAGPIDIEKTITQPIERAVSSSPGVDRVESVSRQGVSIVSAWFNFGTNLDNAQFEVQQRVAQIQNTLPPGLQPPFIIKFDITNIPVVQIAVNAEDLDEKQLYDLAYNVMEPQLERLPGVASATVGGGKVRELTVEVNRDALRARGLGILDVVNTVRASNLLLPSGTLRAGPRDYNVFSNTEVERAAELADVRLGPSLRIGDVAEVVDGTADQTEIVRINGKRGVYLRVFKQPGANTIAVVDAVRAALPDFRGVPASVTSAISFDQSTYIRSAVSALEHEAVQGGLLAMAVILFFLVSLRATAIVSIAIPLSIVATFILLYFTGQSLNVFTLGGLALGVGRLVDDSIVELENIHRHLHEGQSRRQAVITAAQEVAMPIFVSTITTIIVFFPVLFLLGIARNLFLPLALTISFALIMSFFVSRTVTPLLCYYVLRRSGPATGAEFTPTRKLPEAITRWLDGLDQRYERLLRWTLERRGLTVWTILALCAASMLLWARIGTEFFPTTDEGQFTLTYKTPVGTRVEHTEKVGQKVEEAIQRALGKGFTTMLADDGLPLGRTALFTGNTGPHAGNIGVNMVPRAQRTISDVAAAEKVRGELKDAIPGTRLIVFTGGIVKRILNFGSPAPIDVEILGYDFEQSSRYAEELLAALRKTSDKDGKPLLTDLQISREENYPELDVKVDREKAGTLGITTRDVAQTVLASLVGNTQFAPVQFTDPHSGNAYFVNVRLANRFRSQVDDLAQVFLKTPAGLITLDTLAKIERGSGPVVVQRKYLQRIVDVTANVAPDKDLGRAAAATQAVIDAHPPPEGLTVRVGGQVAAQRDAFSGLGFAGLMALALVYMVLASQFRSLVDPLVIMFSVPLGVSGVLLMLWLTGTTLSVNSFMGIIMMVGIVVSNGVLLVDFANVLRGRGIELREATVQAARTRLRPILMTTIATVAGLFPMALGLGEGSETNLPLARAVIGGLTVSTFFTLFLVPSLYTLFDCFARRRAPEDDGDAAA